MNYSEFLAPNFDPLQHAACLQSREGLEAQIAQLDTLLKQTLTPGILRPVLGIARVNDGLGDIEQKLRLIRALMHSLRTRIRVPHTHMLNYTNQRQNLHQSMRYLRAVTKFTQLIKRLSNVDDTAMGALMLADITQLVETCDLAGVELVDREMERMVKVRMEQTIGEADRLVTDGMQRHAQGDVAVGLQILYNLGRLPSYVAGLIRRQYTAGWAAHIRGRMDPQRLTQYVQDYNAKNARAADGSDMLGITGQAWQLLEAMAEEWAEWGLRLRTLERVLVRKRHTVGDNMSVGNEEGSFMDLAVQQLGDRPLAFWWGTSVAAVAAELKLATEGSTVISQMLANQYPRLVHLLMSKLEYLLVPKLGGVVSVGTHKPGGSYYDEAGPRVLWDRLLDQYEQQYVERAEGRMDDSVGRCFPQPPPPGLLDAQEKHSMLNLEPNGMQVPSRKQLDGVARSLSTELEMVKSAGDSRLSGLVAEAAARSLAGFINMVEMKIERAEEESAELVSAVRTLKQGVEELVNQMDSGFVSLSPGLTKSQQQRRKSYGRRNSSFSIGSSLQEIPTSSQSSAHFVLYRSIRELDAFITRQVDKLTNRGDRQITEAIVNEGDWESAMGWLQTNVLGPLKPHIGPHVIEKLVTKYLWLFTTCVCLTMPLTEEVKLEIVGQLAQFEFGCSQLLSTTRMRLADMGDAYKSLRALKPVLFMDSEDIVKGVDGIRLVDLFQHIVCRVLTDKGDVGKLPYMWLGWTKARWIEEVAAMKNKKAVKEALENTRKQIEGNQVLCQWLRDLSIDML